MARANLFDVPPLPGFAAHDQLVSEVEEQQLITAVDATAPSPFRFQGWIGKRLTRSFGWHYDFDVARLQPGEPLPDWLRPIRDRAAAAFQLAATDLVHVLLTRYDPGAGIGWHRDRPAFEHIIGLSLGAPATMRFRRRVGTRFERVSAPLPPRGAYHLSGEARHAWEHSIVEMDQTRWSITFRSLASRSR